MMMMMIMMIMSMMMLMIMMMMIMIMRLGCNEGEQEALQKWSVFLCEPSGTYDRRKKCCNIINILIADSFNTLSLLFDCI
jgi:hypothetical protein